MKERFDEAHKHSRSCILKHDTHIRRSLLMVSVTHLPLEGAVSHFWHLWGAERSIRGQSVSPLIKSVTVMKQMSLGTLDKDKLNQRFQDTTVSSSPSDKEHISTNSQLCTIKT